jgi:hypothetical protein
MKKIKSKAKKVTKAQVDLESFPKLPKASKDSKASQSFQKLPKLPKLPKASKASQPNAKDHNMKQHKVYMVTKNQP